MAESALSVLVDRDPRAQMAAPRVSALWHDKTEMLGDVSMESPGDNLEPPIKPNPLVRSANWFRSWLIPGLGMFMESYMIFSTGQIKTIWHSAYPTCWLPKHGIPKCPNNVQCSGLYSGMPADFTPDPSFCQADGTYPDDMLCNQEMLHSVSYSEFAGIMTGMLALSLVADRLGRRIGSITTALIMFIGGAIMTLSPPWAGLNTMFWIFTIAYGLYGFGVGGEYPTSASSAAEKAQSMSGKGTKRGAVVGMTFSCQGAGAVFGSIVILVLLLIFNEGVHDCYEPNLNEDGHKNTLSWVWRITYGIGVLMTLGLLIYRFFYLKESTVWEENKARQIRKKEMGIYKYNMSNPAHTYYLAFRYYWPRMVATAGTWFLWDVAFYDEAYMLALKETKMQHLPHITLGNKLFSGPIFSSMVPDGNLITINGLILLNNAVALVGYWLAAYLIDIGWCVSIRMIDIGCGRVRLQTFGFLMCTILFLLAGVLYHSLSSSMLLFLYIFSSFWGQCGPNMTTFVTPTELYPAAMRATCHGFSAFMGKAGALIATIAFNYLDTQGIFYVCAAVSAASIPVTLLFLCDLGQMDLIENDRYLEMILTGREAEYQGEAKNPKYCSWYEILTGFCKDYEPDWLNNHRDKLMREMGQLGNDSDMELEAEMVAPPVESGAMEKKQPL